jgi:hypothetical protein
MLRAGIVGLPNVGKSTLFNALTASYQAESANYPFCTIEPNKGIVCVPDARMQTLQGFVGTHTLVPAVFEFMDIAGLVRGASRGEGLGNQFLAHIREVDAIVHLVRCFEDGDITHVDGAVDPLRDIETIQVELCLADLASIEKRLERLSKGIKQGDKEAQAEAALYEKVRPILDAGTWISTKGWPADDVERLRRAQLLTGKPLMLAANVAESDLARPEANPHFLALQQYGQAQGHPVVALSAQIEAELRQLDTEAQAEYLGSLGVASSGIDCLIQAAYAMLGLRTFFTAGEKEVHAWPFPLGATAPQCAGIIHTDFERGFIRAEVIGYQDFLTSGGEKGAKEKGLLRLEGKDYAMQDGDVVHFRFNVSRS